MTDDDLPAALTLGDAKKLLASLKSSCSAIRNPLTPPQA
jgi:hypothetical protein